MLNKFIKHSFVKENVEQCRVKDSALKDESKNMGKCLISLNMRPSCQTLPKALATLRKIAAAVMFMLRF